MEVTRTSGTLNASSSNNLTVNVEPTIKKKKDPVTLVLPHEQFASELYQKENISRNIQVVKANSETRLSLNKRNEDFYSQINSLLSMVAITCLAYISYNIYNKGVFKVLPSALVYEVNDITSSIFVTSIAVFFILLNNLKIMFFESKKAFLEIQTPHFQIGGPSE